MIAIPNRERLIRSFAIVAGVSLFLSGGAAAAVVYTDLPNIPVFQGNSVPTKMRFDLNYDGAWDVEFHAFDDIFKVITSSTTEVFALPAAPPNMGSDLNPFVDASIIGGETEVDGFAWVSGESFFYGCALFGESLVCLGLWGNGVDSLGFRIEEEDGLHYGYITVDTPFLGIHGGFIQGFGYESNPNTGILTGAIPEPSTWIFMGVTSAACLLRRRRKPKEDNNKGCCEVVAIAETSAAPLVEQARSGV